MLLQLLYFFFFGLELIFDGLGFNESIFESIRSDSQR
jgi:hypothetical protein